ncbi:MAG: helix-turn-helix transcriptional regulator [Parvibaculum sp.]
MQFFEKHFGASRRKRGRKTGIVRNRIRHYRRKLGLTQSELGKKLGTTAATVSRLETEGIKISVDWLQPLAAILQVPMTDLLDGPSTDSIPLLGHINQSGKMLPLPKSSESSLPVRIPARDPVAVRLERNLGPFLEGEVLIGGRLEPDQLSQAFNRVCLLEIETGATLLTRLLPYPGKNLRYALVPLVSGGLPQHINHIAWCAPIVMAVRYF